MEDGFWGQARLKVQSLAVNPQNFEARTLNSFSVNQERVASLLPPVHVAVIQSDQIVPDLIDAFGLLADRQLPSNVTFITGPSKTGDIELQLTTGVHGPGQLHVIVTTKY